MSVYISEPRILIAGESCIFVEFANEVSRLANDTAKRLRNCLKSKQSINIIECFPAYSSLIIYFDPCITASGRIIEAIGQGLNEILNDENYTYSIIHVPVCYGGEYGPDIDNVAEHSGISVEEVIERHSRNICHCYMIGFIPGFAYLGGMDESIATPRLSNPRSVITGGSVGIAGKQTGIYPLDSPGGWQLIGRTPLKLFTPEAECPTLIQAGYGVKFVPVSGEEYKKIAAEVAAGKYKPELTEMSSWI